LFKIRGMPEVQAPPPLPKSQPFFARCHSTILKLLGVGALVLVLLIPLAIVTGVLNERLQRRNEAVADITSSWGREQSVIGPVLSVPYQYRFKTVKEIPAPNGKVERREVEETATANAYFLPETLYILAYKIYRCWVSEYEILPDLDANANAVAIEHITLENEGWERDQSAKESVEPSLKQS
jgi:hypothetical protein